MLSSGDIDESWKEIKSGMKNLNLFSITALLFHLFSLEDFSLYECNERKIKAFWVSAPNVNNRLELVDQRDLSIACLLIDDDNNVD